MLRIIAYGKRIGIAHTFYMQYIFARFVESRKIGKPGSNRRIFRGNGIAERAPKNRVGRIGAQHKKIAGICFTANHRYFWRLCIKAGLIEVNRFFLRLQHHRNQERDKENYFL
jgi:hypothetical protein